MELARGSYTGNGVDDRWINDPGFQPDYVRVKADATEYSVFRTSTMDAGDSAYLFWGQPNFANAIQAFGANGFQIGTDSTVNTNTVVYYWVAVRDDGADDFHVGTYTGNGVDDRSIGGVGFQPTFVCVKRDGGRPAVWRVDENVGDDTLHIVNLANNTNRIQAFEADGFQIGTNSRVNENGDTYHYFCFADAGGYIETGTYTGDGNDDRSIAVGFQPDVVWVKGDTVQVAFQRISTMDAGESSNFSNVAPLANRIQAFEANGFQIGTDATVNANGVEYYWAAFRAGQTVCALVTVTVTVTVVYT